MWNDRERRSTIEARNRGRTGPNESALTTTNAGDRVDLAVSFDIFRSLPRRADHAR